MEDGELFYSVSKKGEPAVGSSKVEIFAGANMAVVEATLYQDAPDAHGVKNPEAYEITTSTVKGGDVIPAKMAVGGVIWGILAVAAFF